MTEQRTTRRDFLKTSAAAAAVTTLSLAPNVHAAGSDTIKVGVIGCGGRGSGAADNVLHAADNVQIVALGDVFKFRVDGLRKRLLNLSESDEIKKRGNKVDLPEERCFAGLDCHEKVINTPGVNYVILATPPGFRPLHLQAAVAAGKHIFTEKPVAVDGPGIRKVLAAYEESLKKKLCIVAGTQRRHQAPYLETIKRIHDGEIGDITSMRCFWNQGAIWFRNRSELAQRGVPDSDLAYQLHNWYHFVWTCGDHIVEQHVHNLDVCNWAMKDKHPVRCIGVGSRSARPGTGGQYNPAEHGNIFDQFCIDFEYEDGVHMLSMCRQITGCDGNIPGVSGVSEAVVGTKGVSQVNAYTINGRRVATGRGPDPYVQEHTDLIEAIRGGRPINELKNVAHSTLTAIMGRMAAYTGKAVTWEKALNSQEDTYPPRLAWDMSLPVPPAAVPGKTPLV
ncbi:MAG TPA: Gfo/Idh/MocA family oxidoreductase [Gemmataceae bacterium]|nr:Gfo/Idh/MocA family oxidoreductase [Gemmataceae bacterium]